MKQHRITLDVAPAARQTGYIDVEESSSPVIIHTEVEFKCSKCNKAKLKLPVSVSMSLRDEHGSEWSVIVAASLTDEVMLHTSSIYQNSGTFQTHTINYKQPLSDIRDSLAQCHNEATRCEKCQAVDKIKK